MPHIGGLNHVFRFRKPNTKDPVIPNGDTMFWKKNLLARCGVTAKYV